MSTNLIPECEQQGSYQVKGFNDLPVEIISHVFEFLPFSSLQDARLVCRRWFAASQSPNLLNREITMCFRGESGLVPSTLMKSERTIWNLCLKAHNDTYYPQDKEFWNDWLQLYNTNFWAYIGPQLRFLSFHNCELIKDDLLWILCLCPELKAIEIVGCHFKSGRKGKTANNGESMPKLLHLQSVVIDGTDGYYYDDNGDFFDILVSSTAGLKSLHLLNCMIQRGVYGTAYLTPEQVLGFILKNTDTIVNVSFEHKVYENETALIDLLKIPNLTLRSLITNYPFPNELAHRLESLQVLKLKGDGRSKTMDGILNSLGNLRILELEFCHFATLSNMSRNLWKNLTSLTVKLYIPGDINEDFNSFLLRSLCWEINAILKKLSLRFQAASIYRLYPRTVVRIAKTFPALTDFGVDWRSFESRDWDWAIQGIFKYQVSLQSLQMNFRGDLSNAGLHGERLEDLPGLDDNPTGCSLARLKNLRKLALHCWMDPSVCLEGLILPELTDLSLHGEMVDPLPQGLDNFLINHSRIQRLFLCSVSSVRTIDVIVSSLPRLKYVYIAARYQLTDEQKTKLRNHCRAEICPFNLLPLDASATRMLRVKKTLRRL